MNGHGAYALLILTPILTAIGQALIRSGMESLGRTNANDVTGLLFGAAQSTPVILGLSIYVGCTVLWLLLLSRFELSFAYPFLGLSFVVAMLLGATFLGESVSIVRVMGTLLICAGVALVATT